MDCFRLKWIFLSLIVTGIVSVQQVSLAASESGAYYGDELLEALRGQSADEDTKKTLQRTMQSEKITLGYNQARTYLLGDVRFHLERQDGQYKIHSVYCERDYTQRDFGGRGNIGPGVIPPANVLNTEHTWPQSRFCTGGCGSRPSSERKTDLHHLFPSDSVVNAVRGNFPFGEVRPGGEVNSVTCPGADIRQRSSSGVEEKLGYTREANEQAGSLHFEPRDNHKGNVARALFYFSVMYGERIDSVEEGFLRRWHELDPVDAAEAGRNEAIFEVQKNRNPFIDHPELVQRISDF